MGWTYQQYLNQPEWFIRQLHEYFIEANKPKKP